MGRSTCLAPRASSLDLADAAERLVERRRHLLVHGARLIALDEDRRVAIALEQIRELLGADAGEHRRIGDLVAVEMQDRQHRAVGRRIEELVSVPGCREWPGLGLAVADDAGNDQPRIVEHRAESVREGIAELAALVDGARRLGGRVARNAAREGELAEEAAHALLVLRHLGVELAVGAFEPCVRDDARRPMARPRDEEQIEVPRLDEPIEMHVDEVEPGCGAPMAEEPRLHVLDLERLAKQRVGKEIDLPYREEIRRTPPSVHQTLLLGREGTAKRDRLLFIHRPRSSDLRAATTRRAARPAAKCAR